MEKAYVVSIDMENLGVASTRQLADKIIEEHLEKCGIDKNDKEEYEYSFNEYAVEKFIMNNMKLSDKEMIELLSDVWEIENVNEYNFVDIATGLGYKWNEQYEFWTE